MKTTDHLEPIVLVGAARSGTKALRDALAVATGVPAVPYDVGYVWRYGNDGTPHDRLHPRDVTPRTARMVHSFLGRYADAQGNVIEKTVGTTLRVGYVRDIVPNARFVHLVRNGIDVAESTRRQWVSPVARGYLMQKVRHFPPRLMTTYGRRYALAQLRQRVRPDRRVQTWGPRYPGIDDDLAAIDLLAVCARQWRASVETAGRDFRELAITPVEVCYEELVVDPARELGRMVEELNLTTSTDALAAAAATLRPGSGASQRLSRNELQLVDREIGTLLEEFGYQRPWEEGDRRV